MEIKIVAYDSVFYHGMKKVRTDVLRTPIGLELTAKDIEGEDGQIHIAAIEEGNVIGTVILKPVSDATIKLRQMAVSAPQQGRGLGKTLVLHAEEVAKSNYFKTIELHARMSALIFYEKLGYVTTGDAFTEVTLPTIKMYKHF